MHTEVESVARRARNIRKRQSAHTAPSRCGRNEAVQNVIAFASEIGGLRRLSKEVQKNKDTCRQHCTPPLERFPQE